MEWIKLKDLCDVFRRYDSNPEKLLKGDITITASIKQSFSLRLIEENDELLNRNQAVIRLRREDEYWNSKKLFNYLKLLQESKNKEEEDKDIYHCYKDYYKERHGKATNIQVVSLKNLLIPIDKEISNNLDKRLKLNENLQLVTDKLTMNKQENNVNYYDEEIKNMLGSSYETSIKDIKELNEIIKNFLVSSLSEKENILSEMLLKCKEICESDKKKFIPSAFDVMEEFFRTKYNYVCLHDRSYFLSSLKTDYGYNNEFKIIGIIAKIMRHENGEIQRNASRIVDIFENKEINVLKYDILLEESKNKYITISLIKNVKNKETLNLKLDLEISMNYGKQGVQSFILSEIDFFDPEEIMDFLQKFEFLVKEKYNKCKFESKLFTINKLKEVLKDKKLHRFVNCCYFEGE